VLTVLWADKGGSGTTVAACLLALVRARHRPVLLVDLAGDVPAALGVAEPTSPGVHDWVSASGAPITALDALAVSVNDSLRFVPAGSAMAPPDHSRWAELGQVLAAADDIVAVVDAGTTAGGRVPPAIVAAAQQRVLVTRACYLALRRSVGSALRPSDAIVVHEPGRSLRVNDVAHSIGVSTIVELALDPAVARAVDAGLVLSRWPRLMVSRLRELDR
jgi:hypothetical protein